MNNKIKFIILNEEAITNTAYFKPSEYLTVYMDGSIIQDIAQDVDPVIDAIENILADLKGQSEIINKYLELSRISAIQTSDEEIVYEMAWEIKKEYQGKGDTLFPEELYKAITEHEETELMVIKHEVKENFYLPYRRTGNLIRVQFMTC